MLVTLKQGYSLAARSEYLSAEYAVTHVTLLTYIVKIFHII